MERWIEGVEKSAKKRKKKKKMVTYLIMVLIKAGFTKKEAGSLSMYKATCITLLENKKGEGENEN
ncbi:MAG: hypothetical protein QW175_05765 [Candidatus Bathyarchaeia archaeon]